MKSRMQAAAVATGMVIATLSLGCSDGPARIPTAPTPLPAPTPAPAATLYALSGVVYEITSAGQTPVEGVEVYCDPCGPPEGHSSRTTGANGVYSFEGRGGLYAGGVLLFVAKRGYVLPNQRDMSGPNGDSWMGSVSVTVTGDTRHDIQIIRK
jgi:hypothetical protein